MKKVKVTPVRVGKQNIVLTGGSLNGLIFQSFNVGTFSSSLTFEELSSIDGFFHLRTLTSNGLVQTDVIFDDVLDFTPFDITSPEVTYPITLPSSFATVGGNLYMLELRVDVEGGPGIPQLRRYSGRSFANPTLIDIDTDEWGPSGSITSLLFVFLIGALKGTFFPVETDGTNVLLPANVNVEVGELAIQSFTPSGGEPNATYDINLDTDFPFSSWRVDTDNASFWLWTFNSADLYYGPFAGPFSVAFLFGGGEVFETGSGVSIIDVAIDRTDGMLYLIIHQSSSDSTKIVKLDRNEGIQAIWSLDATIPEGYSGTASVLPYKIAADNGVVYVVGIATAILCLSAVWKITGATGEGASDPAFAASGDALDSLAGVPLATTEEEANALILAHAGMFEFVSDFQVGGAGAGGEIVLRQRDVRVSGGLDITSVPGGRDHQVLI